MITAQEVAAFYTELLGLDHVAEESDDRQMVFRAYPRRGPRIVVRLKDAIGEQDRRRVLIQVASLQDCVERLTEGRSFWEELRGWAYYDRRICTFDPVGNVVELVCYHPF